ncbi:transposase [Longispora sp. NPDC051575]|uniref:RNA-guided endonuclease InsQ/TnpB family protein n=1 Tax=Longispora sp. NPDC051575 TaxID=3154943 RepID=UPI00341EB60C
MLIGRRYRLAPTPAQAESLERWAGTCRSVWNTGLHQRREYRRRGGWMNYVEQARQMAEAKVEFPWLSEAPSDVLQQTLMDLDRSCRDQGTWSVWWRGRSRWTPSMRFPVRPRSLLVQRLGRKVGQVKLPKLGWVRFRWSRPPGGVVRSATVSYSAGRWWVSLLVEDGQATPERHARSEKAVGIDRGVKVAVATSNGMLADRKFVRAGEERRMLTLQRRAARQERHRRSHAAKTSNRARATRQRLSRVWAKIRNRRADFAHQVTHELCRDNALLGIEKLPVKNLTSSASGTVEKPGRTVKQKAGLNRAILDKGWHAFELALHNQARKTGTTIVKVNPAYTSQTCYVCGHIARDNRESQAVFRCVACGHQDHADVNAARNILARALRATGRDGPRPPAINGRISHQGPPLVPRQPLPEP